MSTDPLKNNDCPQPSVRELNGFCDDAGRGDMAAVSAFIDRYPDAIAQEKIWGNEALKPAAANGQKGTVELLLARGVSYIEATNEAVIWAAWGGHTDIVALLLEKGASIEAKAKDGRTSLIWAAWRGHPQTVAFLLEKGADPDKRHDGGWTALQHAQNRGHQQVVDILEQWSEQQRQRLAEQQKREAAAAAEAQAAAHLKKLQKARPAKPVLKRRFP